jgi:hypothetical protein
MKIGQLIIFLFTGVAAISLVTTPTLHHYRYDSGALSALPWRGGRTVQPLIWADLDLDGREDEIVLENGGVEIRGEERVLYRSKPDWRVEQAEFGDLNRDGKPEAVLLVWRDFKPWPIDRLLSVGGRIKGFHNDQGQSCHIILIGWGTNKARESWAGSALADPVMGFAIADLDGDGWQELVTMDGDYNKHRYSAAKAVKIWEWNGFGFSRLEQINLPARQIFISNDGDGSRGIVISTY